VETARLDLCGDGKGVAKDEWCGWVVVFMRLWGRREKMNNVIFLFSF